ncbi:heparan sulfate 2-O-sulfotransferase [Oesophagostomum dentatum]|uniref:Heparan sulfate 2-O-sulfotransferase n=1 Tax=Oesophagostomum dentatum TaxID=61180 RepID=A0A0B1T2U9_OESDE|nr:heparan sulfate 2-O-sulfotransferase [Oesophagostomum dentatum]
MFSLNRIQILAGNLCVIILLFVYVHVKLSPNKNSWRPLPLVEGDLESQLIVIYNRVPKTGSTTFTNAVAYDLFKINNFNVIHLNMTKNRQVMSLTDQGEFIRNITSWTERRPAFYHGHVAFIDFTRFGYPNPVYINIVREPLQRLLSHYYFLRFGDNYRVGLKRSRAGNNETFDECVLRGGRDCDMKQMWLQIPYFCGHHHFCTVVGNKLALEQAKKNLIEKYLLVGVCEEMRNFIAVLERLLPRFFKGALSHFDGLSESRAHLRNTKQKFPPNDHTLSVIRRNEVYQMEREFYDFAKEEFMAIFKKITNGSNNPSDVLQMRSQYHYEKIKPERPVVV